MNFNPEGLKFMFLVIIVSLSTITIQYLDSYYDIFNYGIRYKLSNDTQYIKKYNLLSFIEYANNEKLQNYIIQLQRKKCKFVNNNYTNTININCPIKFNAICVPQLSNISSYINSYLFSELFNEYEKFNNYLIDLNHIKSCKNYINSEAQTVLDELNKNYYLNITIDMNDKKVLEVLTIFENSEKSTEFEKYISNHFNLKYYKKYLNYFETLSSNKYNFKNLSQTFISNLKNKYTEVLLEQSKNLDKLYYYLDLFNTIKKDMLYNLYRDTSNSLISNILISNNIFTVGFQNIGALLNVQYKYNNLNLLEKYENLKNQFINYKLTNLKFNVLDMILEDYLY